MHRRRHTRRRSAGFSLSRPSSPPRCSCSSPSGCCRCSRARSRAISKATTRFASRNPASDGSEDLRGGRFNAEEVTMTTAGNEDTRPWAYQLVEGSEWVDTVPAGDTAQFARRFVPAPVPDSARRRRRPRSRQRRPRSRAHQGDRDADRQCPARPTDQPGRLHPQPAPRDLSRRPMLPRAHPRDRRARQRGFSLIELLVVPLHHRRDRPGGRHPARRQRADDPHPDPARRPAAVRPRRPGRHRADRPHGRPRRIPARSRLQPAARLARGQRLRPSRAQQRGDWWRSPAARGGDRLRRQPAGARRHRHPHRARLFREPALPGRTGDFTSDLNGDGDRSDGRVFVRNPGPLSRQDLTMLTQAVGRPLLVVSPLYQAIVDRTDPLNGPSWSAGSPRWRRPPA